MRLKQNITTCRWAVIELNWAVAAVKIQILKMQMTKTLMGKYFAIDEMKT